MMQRGLLLALTLVALPVQAEDAAPAGGAAEVATVVAAATLSAGEAPPGDAPAGEPSPEAAAPATAKGPDPWEGFNRSVFKFNDRLDRYALKPVAKGYRKVTPRQLRSGITNFFRNLKMPVVLLNDLLQGKVRAAGHDLSRFFVNSTLGFVGFVDASTVLGIPRNDEDFGQTLGVWGVPNGPYLVLPFLGPSTVRDGAGFGVDVVTDPVTLEFEEGVTAGLWVAKVVNVRANLLDVEEIVQGDRYLFMRDLYLQSRDFAVKDGRMESDPFLDDESYEEDAAPAEEGGGDDPGTGDVEKGREGESGAGAPAPEAGAPVQDGATPSAGAAAIDNFE